MSAMISLNLPRYQVSSAPTATPRSPRDAFLENETEQELERICPAAVDLAVECVTALHDKINGRAPDIAGNRKEKYFREQLRCERRVTEGDIARLVIQAPSDSLAFLLPLIVQAAKGAPQEMALVLATVAPSVGCTLMPLGDGVSDLEVLASSVCKIALEYVVMVENHTKDRIFSEDERTEQRAWLQRAKALIVVAENTIATAPRDMERRKVAR